MKQETWKVLRIPLPLLWNCKKLFYRVSFVMWFVMIYQQLFCSLTSRLKKEEFVSELGVDLTCQLGPFYLLVTSHKNTLLEVKDRRCSPSFWAL